MTVCFVGLETPQYQDVKSRLKVSSIGHEVLPRIMVKGGELWAESDRSARMIPISKVVFHGIFENDLDFITALALWGGACLPNPRAMMDARLKFPCLVRALALTRFGSATRGYAAPYAHFPAEAESVAKWGNWHCGENKERFTGVWMSENASIIEPFLVGESVRVLVIGEQAWQIRLGGRDWRKSVHADESEFMPPDPDLVDDTRTIGAGFGLDILANDYIVAEDGTKHLLEVNHIPDVDRFPEIWEAYRDYVVAWVGEEG